VNQHQQRGGKSGKGKDQKTPAWKSDPDFADFKSVSFPPNELKNKTAKDGQTHWGKENERQEEH